VLFSKSPVLLKSTLLIASLFLSCEVFATTPSFSASLSPSTVGPGNITKVTFTLTNGDPSPVTDAAFTNTLPSGLVHATPSDVSSTCSSGTVSASDGGTLLSFSGYSIPASSSCTVTLDVLSSTSAGTYTILTDDLTSSEGNSGTATVALTVSTARPAYSLAFSPSSVDQGGTSTLTVFFDNSLYGTAIYSLSTTVNLPSGLVIADFPNLSHDCQTAPYTATVGATAGSSTISYSYAVAPTFPAIAANGTCSLTVNVKANSVGELTAYTDSATANSATMGRAKATLSSSQSFALMEPQLDCH